MTFGHNQAEIKNFGQNYKICKIMSRDITQISEKGNFVSYENRKFKLHKYFNKGNFYADL